MVRLLPTALLALATTLAAAGPIPATTDGGTLEPLPPAPQSFNFVANSQFSQQEMRRHQRKVHDGRAPSNQQPQPPPQNYFDHSPYGSGAEPVPQDSDERGFDGRTLF